MRLQKQKVKKLGDKEYFKWVVILPQDRITQLGWVEGMELKDELTDNSLCLRPQNKEDIKKIDYIPIYEEFRKSIQNMLERYPVGLSWAELKDKLNYHQKAPNNKWVRKLEKDIGLIRIQKDGKMVWKLEQNTVYTIGYEGLTIEQFIKKLKTYNVERLIDVREIALSRKNGFSRTPLSKALKEAGIRYKHISALGSPSDLRHKLKSSLKSDLDYKEFFKEYAMHIKDLDVQDSITEVEGLAKMKKSVLLCFERDYKTCHRSIIAEELKKRGWKISHL